MFGGNEENIGIQIEEQVGRRTGEMSVVPKMVRLRSFGGIQTDVQIQIHEFGAKGRGRNLEIIT